MLSIIISETGLRTPELKMQCLLLLAISSAGMLANAAEGDLASSGCKAGADADASFIQQTQAALGELTAANLALQQAVDAKDYAAAASEQAKQATLESQLEALKTAHAAACGSDSLVPAVVMEPVANRAWRARLDALVAPLDVAVNRSLGVVQQGLALAASKGYMSATFTLPDPGFVPNRYGGLSGGRSTEDEALGDYYTVEIGDAQYQTTCQILFGENIDVAAARRFYERVNTIPASLNDVVGGMSSEARVICTPEEAFAYAATFTTGAPSAFDDMLRIATVWTGPRCLGGGASGPVIYTQCVNFVYTMAVQNNRILV
jgi:hypothetical protein